MPAPAVIPAAIAYIKVVAVKKLIVRRHPAPRRPRHLVCRARPSAGLALLADPSGLSPISATGQSSATSTLNKSKCSKRARLWREGSSREWWKTTVVRVGSVPADEGHDPQRRTGASVLGRER